MKYMKKSFSEMKAYHSSLITDGIILNANESPYAPPKKVIDLFNEEIKKVEFNRYPDMDEVELDKAIAKKFGIDPECVTSGVGSDELLDATFRAILEPGDEILGFSPSFSMYKIFAELVGAKYIAGTGDENNLFDIDKMILMMKESKAKAVIICSPNNPTGQYFKKEDLIRLIKSTNKLVLLDFAYIDFAKEDYSKDMLQFDNTIVYRTFSKAMALPSIRCGYALSNKENIEMINAIKAPYSVTTLSQILATIAISNYDLYKEQISLIKSERDRLYKEFKNLGFDIYPSESNFFYIKMDDKYNEILENNKIYIRKFKSGIYRFNVGTVDENNKLLEVIKNAKK